MYCTCNLVYGKCLLGKFLSFNFLRDLIFALNTKYTRYESYTRLNFHVFDLRENKVTANISGFMDIISN